MRLTFYTAPISLLCLAPFYWTYEVRCTADPLSSTDVLCVTRLTVCG